MLHSRAMSPPATHPWGPSGTPSSSAGVPLLSELHIDVVGMSKRECSGKRDPSAHLRQPLPVSRTAPALLASHPPMGAHVPDKDEGSVTPHHLQLHFWPTPKHGSAQPSHTVPSSPRLLQGDHTLGATGHPSPARWTRSCCSPLEQGQGTCLRCTLLVQMQPPASTSQLHPATYAPGARTGCLCRHLEGEGGTAEKDGTRNRTGGCWQG